MSHVDLTPVRDLLATATELLEEFDGREIPAPARGRDRGAEMAEITKSLLLLAHLLDKSRLLVLDEYHLARGFTDHLTVQPNHPEIP